MKNAALIVLFLGELISMELNGQKQISDQTHAWVMYFGNHKITDHWGIHTEYQWRREDLFNHRQQSLSRIGIDYYAKNGGQYSFGYAWVVSYPYGDQPIARVYDEHRLWEQFITKSKMGRVDLQHRYRLEQRWLENWLKDSENEDYLSGFLYRNRFRYRLMASISITKSEMADNTLLLSLYDEIFLGFGPNIAKNILDQNRLYAAIGWRFNAKCSLQLGYLNHYIIKPDGIKAERNHTIQIGVFYSLDFRKQ